MFLPDKLEILCVTLMMLCAGGAVSLSIMSYHFFLVGQRATGTTIGIWAIVSIGLALCLLAALVVPMKVAQWRHKKEQNAKG